VCAGAFGFGAAKYRRSGRGGKTRAVRGCPRGRAVRRGPRRTAGTRASEDVAPQVLVLDDALEPLADVRRADDDAALTALREVEEDVLEQRGQDGVQAASADVLE